MFFSLGARLPLALSGSGQSVDAEWPPPGASVPLEPEQRRALLTGGSRVAPSLQFTSLLHLLSLRQRCGLRPSAVRVLDSKEREAG